MKPSPETRSPGLFARRSVQLVIILAVGTALGLIYNTFNPDGIPLVKRMPAAHGK